MDALLDQEHEHLRTAVARVCALRPDVALVEGTVARFARELLLERGVSLALNVKPAAMRRPRVHGRRRRAVPRTPSPNPASACAANFASTSNDNPSRTSPETQTRPNRRR